MRKFKEMNRLVLWEDQLHDYFVDNLVEDQKKIQMMTISTQNNVAVITKQATNTEKANTGKVRNSNQTVQKVQ